MDKLHRLADGTWIELAGVTEIHPYEVASEYTDGRRPSTRAVVVCGDRHFDMAFPSYLDAVEYADHLAALVNDARTRSEPAGTPTEELVKALSWCVENEGECLSDHLQRHRRYADLLQGIGGER